VSQDRCTNGRPGGAVIRAVPTYRARDEGKRRPRSLEQPNRPRSRGRSGLSHDTPSLRLATTPPQAVPVHRTPSPVHLAAFGSPPPPPRCSTGGLRVGAWGPVRIRRDSPGGPRGEATAAAIARLARNCEVKFAAKKMEHPDRHTRQLSGQLRASPQGITRSPSRSRLPAVSSRTCSHRVCASVDARLTPIHGAAPEAGGRNDGQMDERIDADERAVVYADWVDVVDGRRRWRRADARTEDQDYTPIGTPRWTPSGVGRRWFGVWVRSSSSLNGVIPMTP
jgi:hypothetical protein